MTAAARTTAAAVTAVVVLAAAVTAVVVLAAGAGPASAQPSPVPGAEPAAGAEADPAAPDVGTEPPTAPAAEPGVFDVTGRVREAINEWVRELVESALQVPLDVLGETLLATPQVSGPGRVRQLWSASAGIANGFYVLLVLVGGVVVAGHESVQTRYSAKEIAPRLVFGMVASNLSLAAAGAAISAANALSAALLSAQGVTAAGVAGFLRRLLLSGLGSSFAVWIGLAAAVLVVALVFTCLARIALVVLLVAAAPLALACHALPQTEGLALLWWRSFGACLGTQVGQALTLIAGFSVFFSSQGRTWLGLPTAGGLVDLLVVAALLWVMVRIPLWAGRVVLHRRLSGRSLAKFYLAARVARRAAGSP